MPGGEVVGEHGPGGEAEHRSGGERCVEPERRGESGLEAEFILVRYLGGWFPRRRVGCGSAQPGQSEQGERARDGE